MNTLWMASYIMLWIIVVGLAVIMVGALRQLGLIQLRIGPDPGALITPEGLQRGIKAPDFVASDVHTGKPVALSELSGRRLLLVFLSTTCSSCSDLVPPLNAFAVDRRKEVETLIVCHGTEDACKAFAAKFGVRSKLVADPPDEVGQRYEVRMTPFAYLIDEAGTILMRGVVNSWSHLEALLLEEGTAQTSRWEPVSGDLGVQQG